MFIMNRDCFLLFDINCYDCCQLMFWVFIFLYDVVIRQIFMFYFYFNCKFRFGGFFRIMYKIFVLYIMFYLYVKNDQLIEKKV